MNHVHIHCCGLLQAAGPVQAQVRLEQLERITKTVKEGTEDYQCFQMPGTEWNTLCLVTGVHCSLPQTDQ